MRLLPTLQQELHVPTLSAENRLHCGAFLRELHSRQRQWLEQVGPEFVTLCISSFDGETDPQVLLCGFKLFEELMSSCLAGENENLWDELLDVIMCYFPVDFEPESTTENPVTRKDLVDALLAAMLSGLSCGVPIAKKRHSAALMELICEKLGSDSAAAIDDAIALLDAALPKLHKAVLENKLKEYLQIMVINLGQREQDKPAQNEIVKCIESFASAVSGTQLAKQGLTLLFDMVGEYLKPPFKATLWPAVKSLKAWSASGADVITLALPNLIPGLSSPASSGEALDSIVELANSSKSGSENSALEDVLLKSIKNKEVSLQTKLLSISAVAACAKSSLISQSGLESITLEVFDLATKADNLELCKEASHCMSFLAEKLPNFIRDNILPRLTGNALKQETFVLLLCQFISNDGFLPFEICHKLITMCTKHQFDSGWDAAILAALAGLQETVPKLNSTQVNIAVAKVWFVEITDGLIQAVMYCGQDKNKKTIMISDKALEHICSVTRYLARQLDQGTLEDFRADIWSKFSTNTMSKGNGMSKIYFKPFEPSYAYSKNQSLILPFLTSFFCSATPTTHPGNFNDYTAFCLTVLRNGNSSPVHVKAAAKILAAVINKHEDVDEKIWAGMNDFMAIRGLTEESLILATWVTKGILLKGGKSLEEWLDKLLRFTTASKEISRIAADCWWLLLGDTPDLSAEAGFNIKLLHPQRLFALTLPKLKVVIEDKTKSSREMSTIKENMLLILGHLLSLIPSEVQSRELPPLLPLLLESLASSDAALVDSSLSTLMQLFNEGSPEVEQLLGKNVEKLVSEFLRLVYAKINLRTRCKALKCLRRVTRIPQIAPVLVRNRTDVLARLMGLLDDHKRVIRQHGALTVNIWSMVGQES